MVPTVAAGTEAPLAARGVDRGAGSQRVLALDVMRGLVVALMAVDHASAAFNAGRMHADSAFLGGDPLPWPPAQFWTRWVTHLCAPSFLFLAGTAVALSVCASQRRGEHALAIDARLVARGLLLIGLDLTVVSCVWGEGIVVLQVLYAIGAGLVAMPLLRRLPPWPLAACALLVLAVLDARIGAVAAEQAAAGVPRPAAAIALLASGGLVEGGDGAPLAIVAYPLLPWLVPLLLGHAFGVHLLRLRARGGDPARLLTVAGLGALLLFAALRWANGFGNMGLLRADASTMQWLHVSKYPRASPSWRWSWG